MQNPSHEPSRRRLRPLAALIAVTVLALAVWWGLRVADERAMTEALRPFADAVLPTPEAPVDAALADLGAEVFTAKCASCHALHGETKLGPTLEGVTRRRSYPWIRSMVMNPDSMIREDPVAGALALGFGVRMQVAGGMDEARTLAVLEFLRRMDRGEKGP